MSNVLRKKIKLFSTTFCNGVFAPATPPTNRTEHAATARKTDKRHLPPTQADKRTASPHPQRKFARAHKTVPQSRAVLRLSDKANNQTEPTTQPSRHPTIICTRTRTRARIHAYHNRKQVPCVDGLAVKTFQKFDKQGCRAVVQALHGAKQT